MSKKIVGTDEAWESGELGVAAEHAVPASQEVSQQIEDSLGLQMISIRLDKTLIESFKTIGAFHGVGYQPLMRDALKRFAECEMRNIVQGVVESQKKRSDAKAAEKRAASAEKKAA